MNACANLPGLGCNAYRMFMPQRAPCRNITAKRGVFCGVLIYIKSRVLRSISVLSVWYESMVFLLIAWMTGYSQVQNPPARVTHLRSWHAIEFSEFTFYVERTKNYLNTKKSI